MGRRHDRRANRNQNNDKKRPRDQIADQLNPLALAPVAIGRKRITICVATHADQDDSAFREAYFTENGLKITRAEFQLLQNTLNDFSDKYREYVKMYKNNLSYATYTLILFPIACCFASRSHDQQDNALKQLTKCVSKCQVELENMVASRAKSDVTFQVGLNPEVLKASLGKPQWEMYLQEIMIVADVPASLASEPANISTVPEAAQPLDLPPPAIASSATVTVL